MFGVFCVVCSGRESAGSNALFFSVVLFLFSFSAFTEVWSLWVEMFKPICGIFCFAVIAGVDLLIFAVRKTLYKSQFGQFSRSHEQHANV